MNDVDSVIEHLNAFNTIISQLFSMDIKISEEEKCINLLCSLLDSWDNLVMAIGSNNTTLKINTMVATLLSKEMSQKTMEGLVFEELSVRGRTVGKKKGKPSNGSSKSRGKSRSRLVSPGQSTPLEVRL